MKGYCPTSNRLVPLVDLQRHVIKHDEEIMRDKGPSQVASLQNKQRSSGKRYFYEKLSPCEAEEPESIRVAALGMPGDVPVRCCTCGSLMPMSEWDSHHLQHQLDEEDNGPASPKPTKTSSNSEPERQRKGTRHSPAKDLANKVFGASHLRKEPEGEQAVELKKEIQSLVLHQARAGFTESAEGIVLLLRRCLEADNTGYSRAALSGHVDHYFSRRLDDLGWGCGWRNIQMLCSHLMRRDEKSKMALFGGVGYVPEISALQQWLEIAWKQGFDEVGAEQLSHKVCGTHKWIGTTECATLLRSFGFKARIVDFKSSLGEANSSETVHLKKPSFREASPGQEQSCQGEGHGNGATAGERRGSVEAVGNCAERRGAHKGKSQTAPPSFLTSAEGRIADSDRGVCDKGSLGIWEEDRCTVRKRVRLSPHCCDRDTEKSCAHHSSATCNTRREGGSPRKFSLVSLSFDRSSSGAVGTNREGGFERIWQSEGKEKVEEAAGERPRSKAHMRLVEWVWEYFTEERRRNREARNAFDALEQKIYMSNKPPLYFQHQGHSRTIVGIERRRRNGSSHEEVFLLVLDPSQRTEELEKALRQHKGWQRMVKRGVHTLHKAMYQLCYVDPDMAEGEELERLKVLESILHSY